MSKSRANLPLAVDGQQQDGSLMLALSKASSKAPTTKRPSRYDAEVIEAAINDIIPAIEEWASGEDVSDAAEILRKAIPYDGTDSYRLAKAFDRAGWDVDSGLLDALESADVAVYSACDAAVRKWIAREGIGPRIGVGAPVVFPSGADHGTHGEIIGIDRERGTYTVFAESLGHVRVGLGTHGRIFTWEALEAANEI
jgi:hypothetical protein